MQGISISRHLFGHLPLFVCWQHNSFRHHFHYYRCWMFSVGFRLIKIFSTAMWVTSSLCVCQRSFGGGTLFPLFMVFKNALWTILRAENALHSSILHIQSSTFSGGWYPRPLQREGATASCTHVLHSQRPCTFLLPTAWTQTPISAWLANVPIVPVSRNDHRHQCRLHRARGHVPPPTFTNVCARGAPRLEKQQTIN